jgi:hypothetical protein
VGVADEIVVRLHEDSSVDFNSERQPTRISERKELVTADYFFYTND